MSNSHIVNPQLQAAAWAALGQFAKTASTKQAFVAAGDPAMDPTAAQGGGAPPPGGDPSAGGGAPAPAPAPDPSAGGGGGMDPGAIADIVMQKMQAQGMGGGGGGGMVEPIKPKIDVNVELMQIKKMLAKICDAQGIVIPASDMAVNSQDLTQMAMGQGGQSGGQQPPSAIQPIQPMGAAMPGKTASDVKTAAVNNGSGYDGPAVIDTTGLGTLGDKAEALWAIRSKSAGARKTA